MEPFLLLGLIITIGFLSYILYAQTRIPEVLILIILGFILGPIMHVIAAETILSLAPLVSTLALIVIIFENGLSLDIIKLVHGIFAASLFTIFVVMLSVIFVALSFSLALGWPWMHSILLGLACAGTTTVTTVALLKKINVKKEVKNLLAMESIGNDIILIVTAVTLIQFIKYDTLSLTAPVLTMIKVVSVGAVFGAVSGGIWVYVLSHLLAPRLAYISTIGVLLVLYDITQMVEGNGAVAALLFSLILGNAKKLNKKMEFGGKYTYLTLLKEIHFNISFLVSTFFFVMLGIIFKTEVLTWTTIFYATILLGLLLAARWIGAVFLAWLHADIKKYTTLITMLMPRGLVASVLAFLPLKEGIIIPYFSELVLITIVATTIAANIGVMTYQKGK